MNEIKRKLVTFRQISEIKPIEKADAIETVVIDGWEIVVKKSDNFKVGDIVVYFEIDSILPEDDRWRFLEERSWRIKTIKLRGQISQGLVLPVDLFKDEFKDIIHEDFDKLKYIDLTEILNVSKFEKVEKTEELSLFYQPSIPEYIKRTGENRIQNELNYLNYDKEVYFSEKIDGTSTTFYKEDGIYYICSHNRVVLELNENDEFILSKSTFKDNAHLINKLRDILTINMEENMDSDFYKKIISKAKKLSSSIEKQNYILEIKNSGYNENLITINEQANVSGMIYLEMFKKYNIKEILDKNPDLLIQGESIGPNGSGNTKNYYKLDENKFYVFNLINRKGSKLLSLNDMLDFCKENKLNFVPIIKNNVLFKDIIKDYKDLLEQAEIKSLINKDKWIEGFVIRSLNPEDQLSFKVISNKFLIKNGE